MDENSKLFSATLLRAVLWKDCMAATENLLTTGKCVITRKRGRRRSNSRTWGNERQKERDEIEVAHPFKSISFLS